MPGTSIDVPDIPSPSPLPGADKLLCWAKQSFPHSASDNWTHPSFCKGEFSAIEVNDPVVLQTPKFIPACQLACL